jgi:hypothetical protein
MSGANTGLKQNVVLKPQIANRGSVRPVPHHTKQSPCRNAGALLFLGVYIFNRVSPSVEIESLLRTRRSNCQTSFSQKAQILTKTLKFPLLCQIMNWQ